jgi:hypothetical protein
MALEKEMALWMDLLIFIYLGPTVLLPLCLTEWRSAPELGYSKNHAVVTPTRTSWLVWINININISIRYRGILYIYIVVAPSQLHRNLELRKFINQEYVPAFRIWQLTATGGDDPPSLIGSRRVEDWKSTEGTKGLWILSEAELWWSFLFWGPGVWRGSIG